MPLPRRLSPWVVVLSVACAAPPGTPSLDGFELFVLGIAQVGGLSAGLGIYDRAAGKLLLVEATPAVEVLVAWLPPSPTNRAVPEPGLGTAIEVRGFRGAAVSERGAL